MLEMLPGASSSKPDNIEVLLGTTVARMSGDDHLTEVELGHGTTGELVEDSRGGLQLHRRWSRYGWLPRNVIHTDDLGILL